MSRRSRGGLEGVSLSVFKTEAMHGRPRLTLNIGSDVLSELKWKLGERVALYLGHDEDKGRIRFERAEAGAKLSRQHSKSACATITISIVRLGLDRADAISARYVRHEIADGGLNITLPPQLGGPVPNFRTEKVEPQAGGAQ
jgi:hypothetical protein